MRLIRYTVLLIIFSGVLSAQSQEHCANHIILTLVSVNFEQGCDWNDNGSGLDPTIIIDDLNGNNLIFMEVNNLTQIFGPTDNVALSAVTNPNNCGDDYSSTLGIYPIDQVLFEFSIEIFENDGIDCNGYQDGNGGYGDDDYGTAIVPLNILTQQQGTFDVGSCISFNYSLDITPIFEYGRLELEETVCPDFSITVNDIDYNIDNPMGLDTMWGASANGCDSFINIQLDFYQFEDPEISGDEFICFNGTGILGLEDEYAAYSWSTGETTAEIEIDLPGVYLVELTTDEGCLLLDAIVVDYHADFFPTILGEEEICVGEETVLSIDGNFDSYAWSNGATSEDIVVDDSGEYFVTVVNAEGCESINSFQVTALAVTQPQFVGETVFCFEDSTILSIDGSYDTYAWSSGDASSSIEVTEPGEYSVTVTNSLGCENVNTITVIERAQYIVRDTFYTCEPTMVGEIDEPITSPEGCVGKLVETTILYTPIPSYSVIPNSIIISGTSIELYVNIDPNANVQINWYGPDGALICSNCTSIEVAPNESSLYELEIDYHPECQIRELVELTVKSDTRVYIPNTFTPDALDGNNIFEIFGPDILSIDLFGIYDRWGSRLFETSGIDAFWDGTKNGLELVNGVYVYHIELTFNDGTSKTLVGDITLLH